MIVSHQFCFFIISLFLSALKGKSCEHLFCLCSSHRHRSPHTAGLRVRRGAHLPLSEWRLRSHHHQHRWRQVRVWWGGGGQCAGQLFGWVCIVFGGGKRLFFMDVCNDNNNDNVRLSCTRQCPELSHDSCYPKYDVLYTCMWWEEKVTAENGATYPDLLISWHQKYTIISVDMIDLFCKRIICFLNLTGVFFCSCFGGGVGLIGGLRSLKKDFLLTSWSMHGTVTMAAVSYTHLTLPTSSEV